MSYYLNPDQHVKLVWPRFNNFPMVRIGTISDGNSLFHAIFRAFSEPYITSHIDGKGISKREFIRNIRNELAMKLGQPDLNGIRPYDTIAKGQLPKLVLEEGDRAKQFKLENLQQELKHSSIIHPVLLEFVSSVLNIDIYILDLFREDVVTNIPDRQGMYQGRKSIVIIFIDDQGMGHYETVGVLNVGVTDTFFEPSDVFIEGINQRIDQILSITPSRPI